MEGSSALYRLALSVANPYIYLRKHAQENDSTSLAFKSLLALEFLIGSIFVVKTVLFTK